MSAKSTGDRSHTIPSLDDPHVCAHRTNESEQAPFASFAREPAACGAKVSRDTQARLERQQNPDRDSSEQDTDAQRECGAQQNRALQLGGRGCHPVQ